MDIQFIEGVMSASYDKLLTPSHLKSFEDLSKRQFLDLLKTHEIGRVEKNNIDLMMLEEEIKHKEFLLSLIDKDHLIFKVLYINFDHLFLSNLMKSYHLGLKYQKLVDNLSNFDELRYENFIINSISGQLDLEEIEFLNNLIDVTKNLDAQSISDKIIMILHQNIMNQLNKKTDKVIINYLNTETTLLNVMLLIRSKKSNRDFQYFESNILGGGMIDKHILIELFNGSIEEFGKYLSLHFDSNLTDAFKHVSNIDFLSTINIAFDKYMDLFLEDMSFNNVGFSPVIHFTLLKRKQLRLLKEKYYQIKE
ncbi:V-type ATPase subunit [Acholeplasma granularum]|uniref:V-type ATPase subunit n=1 Tax=Acholeplasma granularum TaxID=264635 RepID=UPI0004709333|nr:V-type ATPase subunit [Acholeplasma granularum]